MQAAAPVYLSAGVQATPQLDEAPTRASQLLQPSIDDALPGRREPPPATSADRADVLQTSGAAVAPKAVQTSQDTQDAGLQTLRIAVPTQEHQAGSADKASTQLPTPSSSPDVLASPRTQAQRVCSTANSDALLQYITVIACFLSDV